MAIQIYIYMYTVFLPPPERAAGTPSVPGGQRLSQVATGVAGRGCHLPGDGRKG